MPSISYKIDPVHSSVHFSVRHMMVSNVRGEFTSVSGNIVFDSDNPASSSVEAAIEVASINTRDAQRDTRKVWQQSAIKLSTIRRRLIYKTLAIRLRIRPLAGDPRTWSQLAGCQEIRQFNRLCGHRRRRRSIRGHAHRTRLARRPSLCTKAVRASPREG